MFGKRDGKKKEYRSLASNPILLGVISIYLLYLGIDLLRNYAKLGQDRILLIAAAIVFILIGGFNLYRAIRADKEGHNGFLSKFGFFRMSEEELAALENAAEAEASRDGDDRSEGGAMPAEPASEEDRNTDK